MSSIRRKLTEDEYILISSYYENILASRPQVWDIVDLSRVLFVFGHYVTESLLHLLKPKSIWDIFLFTGVREPGSRAVSQYYQLAKVSQAYPDIEEFVSNYGSSMSDEILRAFPSMVDSNKPKWLNAAEVLTVFDYIYSTEAYAETILPVYKSIGLSNLGSEDLLIVDNVRTIDLVPSTVAQIKSSIAQGDDEKLYSLIKPAIGKENAGKLIADEIGVGRRREEALSISRSGIRNDADYSRDYDLLGYELHLLGESKKVETMQILEARRDRLNELLEFLRNRNY